MTKFKNIYARQVFDSRGIPTIYCKVELSCGAQGFSIVPSGASKGSNEVFELRDGGDILGGKSVYKAIEIINTKLLRVLIKVDPFDQIAIDNTLKHFDGTDNLSNIGGNTILSVSLAAAKAAANSKGKEFFRYIDCEKENFIMPVPMINLINGGAHAGNDLGIQEFMIVPAGFGSFHEAMLASFEVYYALKSKLKSCGVGDEGGFAPDFADSKKAIDVLIESIELAGFCAGRDIMLSLDVAANELYQDNIYSLPSESLACTFESWGDWLLDLVNNYPICSIEDGMAENDYIGWKYLTRILGSKVQLVGDDIFVTQVDRLEQGIEQEIANAVLLKPNQVGTLTDTLITSISAHDAGYKTIMSHRSGDTEDTFIADLAVGSSAGQIKIGGLCRSERVAKYNRLLEIEYILGSMAEYPGKELFLNYV